jgi:hypothetical protein
MPGGYFCVSQVANRKVTYAYRPDCVFFEPSRANFGELLLGLTYETREESWGRLHRSITRTRARHGAVAQGVESCVSCLGSGCTARSRSVCRVEREQIVVGGHRETEVEFLCLVCSFAVVRVANDALGGTEVTPLPDLAEPWWVKAKAEEPACFSYAMNWSWSRSSCTSRTNSSLSQRFSCSSALYLSASRRAGRSCAVMS